MLKRQGREFRAFGSTSADFQIQKRKKQSSAVVTHQEMLFFFFFLKSTPHKNFFFNFMIFWNSCSHMLGFQFQRNEFLEWGPESMASLWQSSFKSVATGRGPPLCLIKLCCFWFSGNQIILPTYFSWKNVISVLLEIWWWPMSLWNKGDDNS